MTEHSEATRIAAQQIRAMQKRQAETRDAIMKERNPNPPPPTISELQARSLRGLDDDEDE